MAAQAANVLKQKQSHKRKRDSPERNGNSRPKTNGNADESNDQLDDLLSGEGHEFSHLAQQLANHAHQNNATPSTAAAALAASMPHITIPQPTELSFQSTNTANDDDQVESSFDMGGEGHQNHHTEGTPYNLDAYTGDGAARGQGGGNKPAVGTDEWHKVRRDNHKEGEQPSTPNHIIFTDPASVVERRRRETINEGINELAKIVPGCDKNKGAILQRGVQYITQLKDNEKKNIEKWTLEKLLTDQAISELSNSNDKLKTELERSYQEIEGLKKRAQKAKDRDTGGGGGTDDDGDSLMDGQK